VYVPGAALLGRKKAAVRWLALLFWVVLCFTVAALGARWTVNEIPAWYRTLIRPWFSPLDWVFGPVWSLLYLLMAVSAWRVGLEPPSGLRTAALLLFAAQLGLNLAWSWIFFRKHAIGAALAEILVLWIAIAATALVFGRIVPVSAWLMAPYLAWVSFASILNGAFWRLNR
jgi:translocator protein